MLIYVYMLIYMLKLYIYTHTYVCVRVCVCVCVYMYMYRKVKWSNAVNFMCLLQHEKSLQTVPSLLIARKRAENKLRINNFLYLSEN